MSIFDDVSPKKKEKETRASFEQGLEWPLDQWYIERILFLVYGGITMFSIFLYFVSFNTVFLILAMVSGIAQILFGYLGIDIFIKILVKLGFKEKQHL